MKKRQLLKIISLMTLFTFLLPNYISFAEDETSSLISADSGILMDAETGQVLYEKNMDKKEFPASITKIMTILLGVESGKMEETITMSRNAVFSIPRDSAHIALDEGEEIKLEDALYGAMLPSANEACNGIAEHISGSTSEFAKLMNERAKAAGTKNTNFVNPNGLHSQEHQTTAYDMAMITKDALKNPDFRKIFGTTSYQIPPTNKQNEIRYLWTTHRMLKETEFYYEKAIGGKTGYTSEALNTLVTVASDGKRELIVVLLRNQSGRNNYSDTKKLFEYGFNSFAKVSLENASVSNSYSSEETDYNDVQAALTNKLKSSEILLYKDLSPSKVNVNFESSSKTENGKEFIYSISLNDKNKYMYQKIGDFSIQIDEKKIIEDNFASKLKKSLSMLGKFIFRLLLLIIVLLVIIYFYVNRNYYRKRILKKLGLNKKKKRNVRKKRRIE